MSKWIKRSDYINPWIQAAKDRGIKLSSKNFKRLNERYECWAFREHGINGGFKAIYEDNITQLIQRDCTLLKLIRKTTFDN
jgi:hypothetical protein